MCLYWFRPVYTSLYVYVWCCYCFDISFGNSTWQRIVANLWLNFSRFLEIFWHILVYNLIEKIKMVAKKQKEKEKVYEVERVVCKEIRNGKVCANRYKFIEIQPNSTSGWNELELIVTKYFHTPFFRFIIFWNGLVTAIVTTVGSQKTTATAMILSINSKRIVQRLSWVRNKNYLSFFMAFSFMAYWWFLSMHIDVYNIEKYNHNFYKHFFYSQLWNDETMNCST